MMPSDTRRSSRGTSTGRAFSPATASISYPATLTPLFEDLIDPECWMSLASGVNGDGDHGLLAQSPQDSSNGAASVPHHASS